MDESSVDSTCRADPAEQIHIPHQCFFLFFSFFVMEAEGMFNHKVD
jgi:hypothetical protein